MKYTDESQGSKSDFREYLKGVMSNMFGSRLIVEGQCVEIPDDEDLEYKVKYTVDEDGCSLTIKVSWDYDVEEETAD